MNKALERIERFRFKTQLPENEELLLNDVLTEMRFVLDGYFNEILSMPNHDGHNDRLIEFMHALANDLIGSVTVQFYIERA